MIKRITLTEYEFNALKTLVDAGVKLHGLSCVKAAAQVAERIDSAESLPEIEIEEK